METLLLYAIISTSLYYLGARAKITKFLWSRYGKRLDAFMLCASCVGTWWGAACGALGWWLDLSLLGLDGRHPFTPVAAACCCLVLTPLLSYVHLSALEALTPQEDDTPRA